MKSKFISITVFSALTLGVAANASAITTINGGTVHFKGEVVNAACAVNANSFDQTVNLGQIRSERLKVDGAESNPVGFTIELNDCGSRVSVGTGIVFSDPVVTDKTGALALQNSAAGSATNVGVQVTDHTGKVTPLDRIASSTFTLTGGTNKVPFQAVYYAVGQATTGIANADVTFKVQYQ